MESIHKKLIRVLGEKVRMGTSPGPFLTTCTRSYLNFRALCSSHLQCPTHCAPCTPCAVKEGKEGVNRWWAWRKGG